MNILAVDDLLNLSIFICKACGYRLQCPIIKVGTYGNVCGACYNRSGFVDATQNIEIETLLSGLHVSCNYKGRGCTYDGNYCNTCEHEKRCNFRDNKICPFAYVGKCENDPTDVYDMIAHISNRHKQYILTVEKNCSVIIQNPSKTDRDVLYLISFDKKHFLLRAWIDVRGRYIFYSFYYFTDDIASKFSINMTSNNTTFTVTSANVNIRHESAIGPTHDSVNALMIPLTTLKYLNCVENVEIYIKLNGDSVKPITHIEESQVESVWIKCPKCLRFVDTISYCINCQRRKCCTSSSNSCSKTNINYGYYNSGQIILCNFQTINLADWQLIHKMPCENPGCNQLLTTVEHKLHKDICNFKKLQCPVKHESTCNWQGLLEEMSAHIKAAHLTLLSQNIYYSNEQKVLLFFKGDDIFKQAYSLASDGNFSITTTKLTIPNWDGSYRWEIRIKRTDIPMITVITDVCTEKGCKKTINIDNYVDNNKILFHADIKTVDF